jgi:hydrogenase maturation protein HypF
LFDAASALLGVCLENRYEAEAAMELEAAAQGEGAAFGFDLHGEEIDLRQTIRDMLAAQRNGSALGEVAARFHETLAQAVAEVCTRVRASDGLERVCLSGGSFQNVRLLEGTIVALDRAGFRVYWHSEIPPNDGGLALGQAAIAAAMVQAG